MSEPKGFCPFCLASGWEICDHFVGYGRGGAVLIDLSKGVRGYPRYELRPLHINEAIVNTGVSIRVYSQPMKGKPCRANA